MTIYPPTNCCGNGSGNGGGGTVTVSPCAPVCLLDYVPEIEHAAILAGTSSYDAVADLQRAINAAYSGGGGVVLLPRGRIFLRGGSGAIYMRSRVTLRGQGMGITNIYWDDRTGSMNCFIRDPAQNLLDARFEHFTISGAGDKIRTEAVRRLFFLAAPINNAYRVERIVWDSVEMVDGREFALFVQRADDITVMNCRLRRINRDGIAVWQTPNVTIVDNYLEHINDNAISCHVADKDVRPIRSGITIDRNRLFMAHGILSLGMKHGSISNNRIFLPNVVGIAMMSGSDSETTIHTINISDNVVSDCIFKPYYDSSSSYYMIGGGLASKAGLGGYPGQPDYGSDGMVSLFGTDKGTFYAADAIGNTEANAPGMGIMFTNNVGIRTLPAVANVEDWGYGPLFVGSHSTDGTGWYRGDVSEADLSGNGLAIRPFIANAHISDNLFSNCGARGIWIRVTAENDATDGVLPDLSLQNVEIVDNDIIGFHVAGFAFESNPSPTPLCKQDIRLRRNRFNGDPNYTHPGRQPNGSWSDSLAAHDLPGVYLRNVSGILIEGNEFANVKNPVAEVGSYTAVQKNQKNNNVVLGRPYASGFSIYNQGVGNMPKGWDGWSLRCVEPESNIADWGLITETQPVSRANLTNLFAWWLEGQFLQCSDPSAIYAGGRLVGWRRLTTGTSNTIGVDWQPISCAHGALSVKLFGAVGDGVTDDTAALAACMLVAMGTGEDVWWPPGTYLTTSSILYLHDVRHRGRGKILVVNGGRHINTGSSDLTADDTIENAVWEVEATRAAINQLYVSPSGSNTNDGLSFGRPVQTIDKAFSIIAAYGPTIRGKWAIKAAAGNYSGESDITGVRSEYPIKLHGPALTKTGDSGADVESPERHAYENPVPTAIIRHSQTGVTGATASGRAVQIRDNVNIELKNIKFLGPWEIGFYCSGFVTYTLRNVHFDLQNDGEEPDAPGQNDPWRKYGKTAISEVFFVRGTIYGGLVQRAATGISQIFSCSRNFDVINEDLRNASGLRVYKCGVGLRAKEDGNGHIDFGTFEDCGTGVELQAWSTANFKGSNFKRCGAGIVLVNGEAHNEGGVDFEYGDGSAKFPFGAPFLMFGNSSALVGFGWEANPGNPQLRNGYRPQNMVGSDYEPTLPGTSYLGATTPNSQRMYQSLCLPANVYNVKGMRFTTKMVAALPAGTTVGTIRFLYYVSTEYTTDVILPAGMVIPAGGAIVTVTFDTVCTEDHGIYRTISKGEVVSQSGLIAAVMNKSEDTIVLTDIEHSVAIDARIANTADSVEFWQAETWG